MAVYNISKSSLKTGVKRTTVWDQVSKYTIVTGGTLYTSGGYNYRVFTGNGSLEVSGTSPLVCDYLVVGGGGVGGAH